MHINDYALLEELMRKLLDDVRNAHFVIARGALRRDIDPLLDECKTTHARLAAALPLNADRARALGYILLDLLGERVESLRAIAAESHPDRDDPATARRAAREAELRGPDSRPLVARDAQPRGRRDCSGD